VPVRWRVALAAVIAAVIVGGLLPHGALLDAQSATKEMVQAAETPLMASSTCADATCGKGNPASSAPTPTVTSAAVLGGLALAVIVAARLRRRRAQAEPLPAGARDPLFRPPQFS
jgi:MYXO-CTERM domain-containing protein